MPNYTRLTDAVVKLVSGPKAIAGNLGYRVDGAWRVVDSNDPSKFYVRFPEGTFVSAYHKNRVIQKPDLPVLVATDQYNRPIILGVDPTRIGDYNASGADTIGPHSHARNSGREYIIDTWLLMQLRVSVDNGFVLGVSEGLYIYQDQLKYQADATIDLSASVAAIEYGLTIWIVVGIDPVNEELIAVAGDPVTYGVTPTIDQIPAIEFVEDGYIPLAAIYVTGGDSAFINFNIEDLRYVSWFSSVSNADIDTEMDAYLDEGFLDRVLTGDDGIVLVDDEDGNILIGEE